MLVVFGMMCHVIMLLLLLFSHIYQPMVNSLVYVANHLRENEERQELMLKSLQLFVQQGIEANKASDRADATHKVIYLSLSLPLSLYSLSLPLSTLSLSPSLSTLSLPLSTLSLSL